MRNRNPQTQEDRQLAAPSVETVEERPAAESATSRSTTLAPTPAPPTPPAPPRRVGPVEKYVDRLTNNLIESLGTRPELEKALARSGGSGSEPAQRLLLLMGDPKNNKKSLSRLASMAGVSSIQLFDIMREYYAALSLLEFSSKQQVIAKNVIEDAQTSDVDCPRCGGWGYITDNSGKRIKKKKCPRCRGKCVVRKAGNADARKLMGEVLGWTKGNSGPTVNVNLSGGNALESVMGDLDRAGMGGKVIDL